VLIAWSIVRLAWGRHVDGAPKESYLNATAYSYVQFTHPALLQRESPHVARRYCRRAHLLLYDSHEISQEVPLCNLYMKPEPTILDTRLKDLPAETENVT